jgi:exonuclease III
MTEKRKTVLRWLKTHTKGIICIQESHSTQMNEGCWNTSIGDSHKAYFSHGESNSRGVITIVPLKLDKYVKDVVADTKGRLLIIYMVIGEIGYTICNLYGPCQDKPNMQIEFINEVKGKISKYPDSKLILLGDFNIIQDPVLDKWGSLPNEKPGKPALHLNDVKSSLDIVDVWRLHNPTLKRFTWRRRRLNAPSQQSRIDYCLLSSTLVDKTTECEILIGFRSDHSLVTLNIGNADPPPRGRGYWKFNNELLEDPGYVNFIKDNLKGDKYVSEFSGDPILDWDALKMMLRRDSVSFAIRKRKNMLKYADELEAQLKESERKLNESTQDNAAECAEEFFKNKAEWQSYNNSKIAGARVRSKAKWIEEGEKNSKYFLNLEKRNQERKTISHLITDNDLHVTSPKDIMHEVTGFYRKLYDTDDKVDDDLYHEFCSDTKLEDSQAESLEHMINIIECKKALDEMPSNKSPGSDGITAEFYKKFWPELKDYFDLCITKAYNTGKLSHDQRTGIITLIPKGDKDTRYVKNWRPISLLNVDYKIIAKTIANRLKPIMPDIIHKDQSAYVKNRLIGHNIRIVDDIIDYCTLSDTDGLLLLLDFEKAFDSISWEFLLYSLKEFGFGPNFIRWIKLLYTDIQSHATVNGYLSSKFELKRGIRQGCPASAFLFIICVELLAQRIRKNECIHGLKISDHEFKIIQFADDTALFLQDKSSIVRSFNILEQFYRCSGLKLNKAKSEAFRLGNNRVFDILDTGLKWVENFRYLGVYFCKDPVDQEYKNYRHRLDNIKNLLNIWLQRDLSLKGKITVIRTLAMSQLIFPLSMTFAPEWVVKEAEKLFYKFLWKNKNDKIGRTTIIKKIEEGGLKMIDVDSMARALKTKWLSEICNPENNDCKWTAIPKMFFRTVNLYDFSRCSFNPHMIPGYLPGFYKQILYGLWELRNVEIKDAESIVNQLLWYNKSILQNKKPLFYHHWYNKGILTIGDLVGEQNKFLKFEDMKALYDLEDKHFLEYITLCKCIPLDWRRAIYSYEGNLEVDLELGVYITDAFIPLETCSNKMLYNAFVDLKSNKTPKSETIWENILEVSPDDLPNYYTIPFRNCKDCKVQSMQYKILYNMYITKKNLCKWGKKPEPTCLECDEVDDLPHHFFACQVMRGFWSSLIAWFSESTGERYEISLRDVLLGIVNQIDYTYQLNYIILMAKWYIFRTKYRKHKCSILEFLPELKWKLRAEEIIYHNNNKHEIFVKTWSELYFNL